MVSIGHYHSLNGYWRGAGGIHGIRATAACEAVRQGPSFDDGGNREAARARIDQIVSDVEPGRIYEGKVAKIMDFGAFVTILPGKDGLVHVSQISDERVEKVSDKLKEGDIVKVKVLEVDKQGRIRLSMKAVTEGEDQAATEA